MVVSTTVEFFQPTVGPDFQIHHRIAKVHTDNKNHKKFIHIFYLSLGKLSSQETVRVFVVVWRGMIQHNVHQCLVNVALHIRPRDWVPVTQQSEVCDFDFACCRWLEYGSQSRCSSSSRDPQRPRDQCETAGGWGGLTEQPCR